MIDTKYPWLMLASVYITQYIGLAFIMSAAVAILRQQGIALDKLALLNFVALPLMGKVLYAPFIDKYRLVFQGAFRGWLILAQGGMAAALLIAGAMDFKYQFNAIIAVLVGYVLFMSIQDVAVDGLSCKLFDYQTRKFANSIQFSGNLMGNIIGGGLVLMFYPWLQWQGSLALLAILTAFSLLQIIRFNEPEAVQATASTQQETTNLLAGIASFIKLHYRWFVVMALYPIGSTCGFALLNPMLVDSGWLLDEIGFALKIFGSIIGLVFALLATPLITKMGRCKTLVCSILIQAMSLTLIIPISLGITDKTLVYAAIALHFVSFPILLVVSATMMMDKATNTQAKATFFTLQFSFSSLLGFAYSALSLTIAQHIGYTSVVSIGTALTMVIALCTWLLVPPKTYQQSPQTEQVALNNQ